MIRQIIRGCRTLPHVGEHPGTWCVFMFVLIGALAGAERGGWRGALGGAIVMALFILPIYFYGAYDRAKISDRISAKDSK